MEIERQGMSEELYDFLWHNFVNRKQVIASRALTLSLQPFREKNSWKTPSEKLIQRKRFSTGILQFLMLLRY